MNMTRAQALAEARRRWGPEAFAMPYRHRPLVMVGIIVPAKDLTTGEPTTAHVQKGEGHSWEAAFADADKREGGAK